MFRKLVLTLAIFLLIAHSQTTNCEAQDFIIPYDALDDAFDAVLRPARNQAGLITMIENPTGENVKNYLLSMAPYSAPLFAMAGVTFIVMVATIVQVICFNTCGKE